MQLVHQKLPNGHNLLQVWKKAWWATSSQLQVWSARMTIERGSQVTKAIAQLRIIEQHRRGNRHGSSPSQLQWATARDHWRRCPKRSHRSRKPIPCEKFLSRLRRPLGQRCRIQTTNVRTRTQQGRNGATGTPW